MAKDVNIIRLSHKNLISFWSVFCKNNKNVPMLPFFGQYDAVGPGMLIAC